MYGSFVDGSGVGSPNDATKTNESEDPSQLPRNYFNETRNNPHRHELLRRQNAHRRILRKSDSSGRGTVLHRIFPGKSSAVSTPSTSKAQRNPKTARRTSKAAYKDTAEKAITSPSDDHSDPGLAELLLPATRSKPKAIPRRHSFWYSMLNPHSKQWQAVVYKRFISTVIITDLVFFTISTDTRSAKLHGDLFMVAEGVVSCIFLLEYVARLVTITEKPKYGERGAIVGRLWYALGSSAAWIDLLATSPFFIERITGFDLPTLTVLRMFRLFRILKTESYIRAMDAVYRVVYFNSEILHVALLVCVFLTLATAILLYLLRPENDDDFSSIAATLYLSTLMLTGQGGPQGDMPWYTKAVVLLTSIFSVAMFAIPSSMLTWGFEAEAARMAKRALKRKLEQQNNSSCQLMSSTTVISSSSSSSSGGDTTDDEYFREIAGEESGGDGSEETLFMKQVREAFDKADRDADGTLTLAEATRLVTASQQSNPKDLAARVTSLEDQLKSTNAKLDMIIQLLQNR